jgi:hypothetical protein
MQHPSSTEAVGTASTAPVVGTVRELWRYPVKSMLGTTADELLITARGALGDREWALRDLETGRIASAKRFHRLLDFRAGYESEPTLRSRGRGWIRTPDGDVLHTDDVDISERLSQLLDHPLGWRTAPGWTRRRPSTEAQFSGTSRCRT